MEKLPIYYLEINEEDETGVNFVALVDKPAIELNWKAFNNQFVVEPNKGETQEEFMQRCIPIEINAGKEKDQAIAICYSKWEQRNFKAFQTVSEERRIITGALMLANTPIYRKDDLYGEYNVVFTKDTIEKIVTKFFKHGNQNNVNAMHSKQMVLDGITMFESFIVDKQRGIQPPKGFEGVPDGSWFGSFKIDNDEVWNNYIKTGVFKGFSVEGLFNQKEQQTPESQLLQAVEACIKALIEHR